MAKKKAEEKIEKSGEPKPDLQKIWMDRINRAKRKREEWAEQFRVKLAEAFFDGNQNPGFPDGEWITINKIYSQLMAELPGLYSVDPYFYVKTKRSFKPDPQMIAQFEQKAKIRQAYLNYLKGELEMKEKCRLAIQDAHFSYGVLKIHYYTDQVENKDYKKEMEDDEGNVLKDEEGNALTEPEYIPVNERYCLSRVDPEDFLFSADAGPLEDKWPFIAERIRLTKSEAQDDKRLNKSILKTLQPGDKDKDKSQTQTDTKNKEDEVFVLWEIYDLKKKQWLIVSEDADAPLREPSPLPKGVECHPYAILRFTLRTKSAYPLPPISQRIDPQKEYCMARSRYLVHRKRFNRKYEVFMGGLTDELEADKLEAGEDGTLIRKLTAQPVVTAIQDAPLDQNGWQEINYLSNDLNEISGYGGNARGIADSDSATEADILEKRLNIREGDRLSLVSEWILRAAKKLDQLVQANISRDEAVRITGPQGEMWQAVRPDDYEDIEGEFEYTINVGATSPQLPQLERAQFLALLTLLGNFPQLMLNPQLMKRVFEMHNVEDEVIIQELMKLAQQMMSGQLPMPGQAGSQPGSPGQPGAGVAGAAMGALGGLFNGGGAKARDGMQ